MMMTTLNDFIKAHGLKVDAHVTNDTYICTIESKEKGKYTFSMTKERLMQHIEKFAAKQFRDAFQKDAKLQMTHFMRIAVYWWHIQVIGVDMPHEIEIK